MATTVLVLAYDGAGFAGFARQEGQPTVQGRLEDALATVLRRDVETVCAGRTDAGVHALAQVVSFHAAVDDPPSAELLRSLNALSGPEIVVREAREASDSFSARHDAKAREYRYRLVPGPVPPLFLRDVAWWSKGHLDLEAMREAAAALIGEHDFASFCVGETAARVNASTATGTRRGIESIDIDTANVLGEHHVVVRMVGRSFLHSMVRIVVGTLVEVGRGKRPPAWVGEVLEARDRAAAGQTAPAHGLTLWHVFYEDDVWL
jgi:tRNA pseudouridine38-40 synthase